MMINSSLFSWLHSAGYYPIKGLVIRWVLVFNKLQPCVHFPCSILHCRDSHFVTFYTFIFCSETYLYNLSFSLFIAIKSLIRIGHLYSDNIQRLVLSIFTRAVILVNIIHSSLFTKIYVIASIVFNWSSIIYYLHYFHPSNNFKLKLTNLLKRQIQVMLAANNPVCWYLHSFFIRYSWRFWGLKIVAFWFYLFIESSLWMIVVLFR